jgi:hypothetical protein
MCARYHRPTLLGCCLVLLQLRCCAAEVTFPTTVEVDLVFPRNDTYAPSAIFPIVLAVHNAHAAVALDPQIRWYIDRVIPPRNTTMSPGGAPIHLTAANLSSSDLYLTFGGLYGHLDMGTFKCRSIYSPFKLFRDGCVSDAETGSIQYYAFE